ncbi:MAG TPA: nickel-binding protein [Solirubrobacter sp.]|jgi:hypothetical protein|nr:nickel-binding protein [Solirubrobacter sp.]
MNLYVVPRTRAWLSEEELAATGDCGPAVIEALGGEVRFVRSYIVEEDDGTLGGYCIYEATGPEAIQRYTDAMRLPLDAIKPILKTVVAA